MPDPKYIPPPPEHFAEHLLAATNAAERNRSRVDSDTPPEWARLPLERSIALVEGRRDVERRDVERRYKELRDERVARRAWWRQHRYDVLLGIILGLCLYIAMRVG